MYANFKCLIVINIYFFLHHNRLINTITKLIKTNPINIRKKKKLKHAFIIENKMLVIFFFAKRNDLLGFYVQKIHCFGK